MSAMSPELLHVKKWAVKVWSAATFGGAVLVGLSLVSPNVEPLAPTGVWSSDYTAEMSQPGDLESENEFVTRPLLVSNRQPWLGQPGVNLINEDVTAEPVSEQREIKDLRLLGVFASGDAQGVIVKNAQGQRRRLLVGDKENDWTLVAVEPRSALFRDGSSEGRLNLAVASSLASGASNAVSGDAVDVGNDGEQEGEVGGSEQEAGEPASFVPTFEQMYREKARLRRSRQPSAKEVGDQTEAAEPPSG